MPTTPVLGLPYPVASDTADVPRDIGALALALDGGQQYVPVGGVILWPVAGVPAGALANGKAAWLICNGQVVVAVDYPKLAALLGQAGGNVTIPNLMDRLPLGASASKPVGQQGGEETHLLTVPELPAHAHPDNIAYAAAPDHAHPPVSAGWHFAIGDRTLTTAFGASAVDAGRIWAQIASPSGTFPNLSSNASTGNAGAHSHAKSGGVLNTGGGTAMNNLPPYLSMNFVMRAA